MSFPSLYSFDYDTLFERTPMNAAMATAMEAHMPGLMEKAPAAFHNPLREIRNGLIDLGIPWLTVLQLLGRYIPQILAMLKDGITVQEVLDFLRDVFGAPRETPPEPPSILDEPITP